MGTDALRLGHQAIYQQQLDLDQANDTIAAAGFRSFSLQEAALAIPDEEAIALIPDSARIMIGGFIGGRRRLGSGQENRQASRRGTGAARGGEARDVSSKSEF
jgi:hypothetical protein